MSGSAFPVTTPLPPSPHPPLLVPSILAGDHADLAASLETVHRSGVSWLHLDIMDGHFVPNLTFGPQTIRDLRRRSRLFFDVHLMLDQPADLLDAFLEAGADLVSIHAELDLDHATLLGHIRSAGKQTGLVLNPDTPAEAAFPLLDQVDLVLVMTVQPGFGGQAFREECLDKLARLHRERLDRSLTFRLEVDGGIDAATAPRCHAHGADTFVAGTAFFKNPAELSARIAALGA
ncbi:MAG: ribulose-phosphate 3-epimerase [Puniceicoccaceae bacterium]|nr:MAG: ribulose-phosphate 3-epimerase [Puniceicoccaceae bacterium]